MRRPSPARAQSGTNGTIASTGSTSCAATYTRYDPAAAEDTITDAGKHTGAVIPRASGGFILATVDGFDVLHPDGRIDHLLDVEADDPTLA